MKARKRQRTRGEAWVGLWLRDQRTDRNLDMEDIAKRLRRSRSAISRMETGNAVIAADDLSTVLKAYSTSIDEFAAAVKAAA